MNGNEPLPEVLEFGGTIFGGQITPPTGDPLSEEPKQAISLQLPTKYARPWRVTCTVGGGGTQAYNRAGVPLQPSSGVPPTTRYIQTRRARLIWQFDNVNDPVVTDLPAQGGTWLVACSKLIVSVLDPGPDAPGDVPKYQFHCEEAPTAPKPAALEAMPRFTQDLSLAIGGGSSVGWVVPRRARAMWLRPNAYRTGIPPAAQASPWLVEFYDGQSNLCAFYAGTFGGSPNLGWPESVAMPVPSAAITYRVENTGSAGTQIWERPQAIFAIDL